MGARMRRYFISGLVTFLPVALTVYLLYLAVTVTDNFLARFIEPYFVSEFGFYFRGLSILVCLLGIFLIGFFVANFLGRKLHIFFESILLRLPFFKQVYPAIKEFSIFLFVHNRSRFRQVVFLEYPRKGVYSLGFITNDTPPAISEKLGKKEMCNVFVPSSPGPFTGFVVLVPKEDLVFSEMTVEQGLKLLVSGGVISKL